MESETTQKAPPCSPPLTPQSAPRPHTSPNIKSKNVTEKYQRVHSHSGSSPHISPKPTSPLQIQPQRSHASDSSSIESSVATHRDTLKKNNRLLKTTIDALIKRITKLESDNRALITKSENWSQERRILYERLENLEEVKKEFKCEEAEWIEERAVWRQKVHALEHKLRQLQRGKGPIVGRNCIQVDITSHDPVQYVERGPSFASPPVQSRHSESIDQRYYAWRPQPIVPKGIDKNARKNSLGGGNSSLESSFVYFDGYRARFASLVSSTVNDPEELSISEEDALKAGDDETTSSNNSDTSSSSSFCSRSNSSSSSSSPGSEINVTKRDDRARRATENLKEIHNGYVPSDCKREGICEVPDATSFFSRTSSSNLERTQSIYEIQARKEELSFPLGPAKQNRYVEEEKNQIITLGRDLMMSHSFTKINENGNEDGDEDDTVQPTAEVIENSKSADVAATNRSEHDQQHHKSSRVFDIINTMTMMLTKKALATALNELTSSLDQDVSFQFFFLLSKNLLLAKAQLEAVSRGRSKRKSISAKSHLCDWGTRFLDPFTFKHADCIDTFPSKLGNASLDPSEFSQFCCTEGIRVRIIPRVCMEGAKRDREWLKKIVPQYKVLAFTDDHGGTIHGVSITVLEELVTNSREAKLFQWSLLQCREQRQAARKLTKWGKEISCKLRASSIRRKGDLITNIKSLFKNNAVNTDSNSANQCKSIGSKADSISCITDDVNEKVKALARESFDSMNAASAEGDSIFLEKCYVIIGGKESEQLLKLRFLQHMIQMEQEEMNEDPSSNTETMHPKLFATKIFSRRPQKKKTTLEFRQEYLKALQKQMKLPSSLPHVYQINLPTYAAATIKESITLPLPSVSAHWGVVTLLTRINPNDLLLVLQLLLIERSVLIIGEGCHLVTTSACALITLIEPFNWASNFMPLLPSNMIDFVNTTVPFLAGMAVDDFDKCMAIENDDRVREAIRNGLSVVNLCTGKVTLTSEQNIVKILKNCPSPKSELEMYSKKLIMLQERNISLRSFSCFIDQGISSQDINVIDSIRGGISKFLKGLAADIATANGWKNYGKYDEGNTFHFYPSIFIKRRKEHHESVLLFMQEQIKSFESRLQFQEMLAHSQLFIEYVDGKRKESLSRETVEKYIASWVYYHWTIKKRRQFTQQITAKHV